MHTADLFDSFDAAQVAAIQAGLAADRAVSGQARATKAKSRHHTRRANAEKTLADLLPARFEPGESWHIISRGDIDSLSYLRHALTGTTHFDHVLLSTWCIAKPDIEEIATWLDTGRIDQFDLYAGEIFPNQYGDEYEQMQQLCATYGARLVIAKNHSKVTLCHNAAEAYHLVIESSANVNTNPRIEQSAIHCDADLHAFYAEFFSGIKSIDKHSAPVTS
ncbi:MAG TPA: hypothetical protein PLQ85_10065 [Anaerolineae bacterium]|nr:hypothetical protein [Anaerolineae bacterium]